MEANGNSKSLEIRKRLNHPILDSDGHWLEFEPAVFDYLKDVAGADMVSRYQSWQRNRSIGVWYRLTPEERRDMRALRAIWWGVATKNTRDGDASEAALRTPRRNRHRFHGHISQLGVVRTPNRRRRSQASRMPRLQQFQCRFFPRLFGSNDAGGGYPDAYAAGSARGTGICGKHARPQDAVHGRLRDASDSIRRAQIRGRGGPVRLLAGFLHPRQPIRL